MNSVSGNAATPPPALSQFKVQLTKAPKAKVDVSLAGPRPIKGDIKKGDPRVLTFDLEAGEWELTVRSEGCRNFKVPFSIPGTENVSVALSELPNYWAKKRVAEQREINQANRLKARKVREAELKRKRAVARKAEQEAREQQEQEDAVIAAAASADTPTATEYEAAILASKEIVEQELAEMEFPADSDPAAVLELLASRLGEEGSADEFDVYLEHLNSVTTSDKEEAAKLIFLTRDVVLKTSADQSVTLMKAAKGLCDAAPAAGGTGQDLRLLTGAVIFGMAHLNPK